MEEYGKSGPRPVDFLREDEKILDGMFDWTKYEKELDALAVTLVVELIRDMDGKGGFEAAVKKWPTG